LRSGSPRSASPGCARTTPARGDAQHGTTFSPTDSFFHDLSSFMPLLMPNLRPGG
jgi:hypothetical protein